jgi:FdhD protein
MKTISKYSAKKISEHLLQNIEEYLVVEESLLININGNPFTLTMRSPGFEKELTIGLLFTEKIIEKNTPYEYFVVEKRNGIITAVNVLIDKVYLKKELLDKRNLLSVSSCGICGKTELNDQLDCQNPIESKLQITATQLLLFFDIMKKNQVLFSNTSGCHAAALMDVEGNLIAIMEDIGRHNAVDKVIGDTIIRGIEKNDLILLVSGRVSYEIVTKSYIAGFPILAAISAPSSLAVDLSADMGITLLGFCRENRVTCYTHNERIII